MSGPLGGGGFFLTHTVFITSRLYGEVNSSLNIAIPLVFKARIQDNDSVRILCDAS